MTTSAAPASLNMLANVVTRFGGSHFQSATTSMIESGRMTSR